MDTRDTRTTDGYSENAGLKWIGAACAGGAVAFPATLYGIQRWAFLPAGLTSASSPLLRCIAGVGAVGLSGLVATQAFSGIVRWRQALHDDALKKLKDKKMAIFCACGSIVAYSVLGGRPWRHPFPSQSLLVPGTFSKGFVPVRAGSLNEALRDVALLGRKHGCHSCGRRFFGSPVVADRQPSRPLKVEQNSKQESEAIEDYYPQCQSCSTRQSTIVSDHSPNSPVGHHPFSTLRARFIWLPFPIIALLLWSSQQEKTEEDEKEPHSEGTSSSSEDIVIHPALKTERQSDDITIEISKTTEVLVGDEASQDTTTELTAEERMNEAHLVILSCLALSALMAIFR